MCTYAFNSSIGCQFLIETDNNTSSDFTFASLGLPYLDAQLKPLAQNQAKLYGNLWQGVIIHEYTGLSEMSTTSVNVTFPSSTQSVTMMITDPYFLYLPSANITSMFDFASNLKSCCRLLVQKIQIDSTVYIQGDTSMLQSFINTAATKEINVELYFTNPAWGFTASQPEAVQILILAAEFIYNATATYPASSGPLPTMPVLPTGTVAIPTIVVPTNTTGNTTVTPTPSSAGNGSPTPSTAGNGSPTPSVQGPTGTTQQGPTGSQQGPSPTFGSQTSAATTAAASVLLHMFAALLLLPAIMFAQ